MSGKRVIELRDVAIYHAENPFGRQSAVRLVRSGELVLSEVDFSVEEGEFVYLIGRVGSGKSTLLKTQAGEPKQKSDAVSTKYCNWSGWKPSTTRCRSNFRAESSNAW